MRRSQEPRLSGRARAGGFLEEGEGRLALQRGSQMYVAQMRGALQLCSGITRYFVSSPRQMGGATWFPLCDPSKARGRPLPLGGSDQGCSLSEAGIHVTENASEAHPEVIQALA